MHANGTDLHANGSDLHAMFYGSGGQFYGSWGLTQAGACMQAQASTSRKAQAGAGRQAQGGRRRQAGAGRCARLSPVRRSARAFAWFCCFAGCACPSFRWVVSPDCCFAVCACSSLRARFRLRCVTLPAPVRRSARVFACFLLRCLRLSVAPRVLSPCFVARCLRLSVVPLGCVH